MPGGWTASPAHSLAGMPEVTQTQMWGPPAGSPADRAAESGWDQVLHSDNRTKGRRNVSMTVGARYTAGSLHTHSHPGSLSTHRPSPAGHRLRLGGRQDRDGLQVRVPRRTRRARAEPVYLVAGRVLTRVKNTDGSTSTCSPRDRLR